MNHLVQVRPLDTPKWHGLKGKDSFSGTFTVTALVDANSRTYKTGLSQEEIENYGKELNMDLTPRYDERGPHPFWDSESAAIKLENRTNFIDKSHTMGNIHYKILLNSKFIANSMREFDEGLWPDALFVIVDEETDNEIKASKIALIKKAVLETHKLPKDRKAAILLILTGVVAREKSDNFVEVALNELIQEQPEELLKVLKMNKDEIATQALVLEGIRKNILTQVGHRILYMDSVIGEDIYSAVTYLEDPKNQELKVRILSQLNK